MNHSLRFVSLVFLFSALVHAQAPVKKEWTYLFFIAGDEEEIDPYSRIPVRKLEQVGSDSKRWMVAHVDLYFDDALKQPINEPARRYLIERNPGPFDAKDAESLKIRSPLVWSSPEPETDSSAGTSLADFLAWGMREYPAEHYAVFVLGHSWGWRGIGQDFRPGYVLPPVSSALEIPYVMASPMELREALQSNLPGGRPFDLLVLDACNDGVLEMAYELGSVARYLVAAVTEMPFMSFDYERSFSRTPDTTASFVRDLVTDSLESFKRGGTQVKAEGDYPVLSMVGIDLARMKLFWPWWGKLMRALEGSNFPALFLGEKNIDFLDDANNGDLVELLTTVREHSDRANARRLAHATLKVLGEPNPRPAPDSQWVEILLGAADSVRVTLQGDEILGMEKALVKAQTQFDHLNPHLRGISKQWTATRDAGVEVRVSWTPKGSLRLRPFIAGSSWAIIETLAKGQMIHARKLEEKETYYVRDDYPFFSPYIVTGHTFGAGRANGLGVHLDPVVDPLRPENHHWQGGQWISGREYYRALPFSHAFGWANLLFGPRPVAR